MRFHTPAHSIRFAVITAFARFIAVLGLVFLLGGLFSGPAHAQAQELYDKATQESSTPSELELYVIPLTADQLSELAAIWQGILAGGMQDYVLLNQELNQATGEAEKVLREKAVAMADTNLVHGENLQIVLNAWSSKGGKAEDIAVYQSYHDALTAAAIQTSDTKAMFSLALDWMVSRDGGLGLLIQGLLFFGAFLILLFLARFVRRLVERGLLKLPAMSRLLRRFVLTVVYWATVVLGLLVVLGLVGVNVTPLFAVFGGLSFILGFALQDTLGNLASGLMIMVLKPFDTGDYIEISGASGVVDSMSVVSTQIRTFDNQIIVVPNSKIWGDVITNVSAATTRRVDMVFGIAYSDNAAHAIEVLSAIIKADKRCLADPEPAIFVGELGDSSVNVFCRPWVKTDDYWDVYWDVIGVAKERFDEEGISIPFPQRDVHLFTEAVIEKES